MQENKNRLLNTIVGRKTLGKLTRIGAIGVAAVTLVGARSQEDSTPAQDVSSFAVIPQELNLNNFRKDATTESQVWLKILDQTKNDYAKKDLLKGSNSMLTTLSNLPATNANSSINFRKDFGVNPKTEPGLWQTPGDWDNFRDLYQLDSNTTLLSMIRINENKLMTAGIYGRTDDKDAVTYYMAGLIVASKHETVFTNTTIGDLRTGKYPAQFDAELVQTQNQIYAQIQRNFLQTSAEENTRRANGSDGSSQIPDKFRKPDQDQVCEVGMASSKIRDGQQQFIHLVTETDGGAETFDTVNVGR